MSPPKRLTTDNDEWNRLLESVTVRDVCHQKQDRKSLLTFTHTTSLREALKELDEHGVLSAPVVDGESKVFLGFIDVLDISIFVWKMWKFDLSHFDRPNPHSHHFFNTELSYLLHPSEMDKKRSVKETATLKKLIQLFNKSYNAGHIHRVVVLDDNNQIVDVCSQSDIISWFHSHIDEFPNADLRIQELPEFTRPLIMVRMDSTFPDALEILIKNRVTGIAIVDDQYHISGNFSASDMKGIGPRSFQYFRSSLMQFLVKGTHAGLGAPITCVPAQSLREVIETLTTNRIHRVYVVDQNSRPVSLVTMTDILALCIEQKEPKAKRAKHRHRRHHNKNKNKTHSHDDETTSNNSNQNEDEDNQE